MNKKIIGILGGMGPEASVYMYKTLIDLSVKKFGAKNNDDFPEIILYSVPVPDFISNDKEKKKALNMLVNVLKNLDKSQIESLSIACNTAHLLLPELQKHSKVEFTSMIDEVVKKVKQDKLKRVGVLGTPSTIRSNLYQSALNNEGIEVLNPNKKQIRELEKIIRNVIAGKLLESDTKKIKLVANSLEKKGAEGIVLGCTELPLVFPATFQLPIYNSVEILSLALLHKYYNQV